MPLALALLMKMAVTFGHGTADASGKAPCKELAAALRQGTSNVLKHCDALSCSTGKSTSGNACQEVTLPLHCQPSEVECGTLGQLLNSIKPAAETCNSDSDCNYPHGACSSKRCECVVDPQHNVSFGGSHCNVDNRHAASDSSNSAYTEDVFGKHYQNVDLDAGQRGGRMAASGSGSTLAATTGIRHVLPALISGLGIRTIIDAPCGDFGYMRHVLSSPQVAGRNISYVGVDLVHPLVAALNQRFREPGRVEFMPLDFMRQELWPADLLIVRDVLFHFDLNRSLKALQRINRSGAKFLLTTFYPKSRNNDFFAAGAVQWSDPRAGTINRKFVQGSGFSSFYRINLLDAPFHLPPPLLSIGHDGNELEFNDRVVGLWQLPLWGKHQKAVPGP